MGSGLLGGSTIAEESSIAERNLDTLGQAGSGCDPCPNHGKNGDL